MMRILLLSFILLFSSAAYTASLKITVSSRPIANIVQLVIQDNKINAKIDVIASSGSCPHEYILKPSDFAKTKDSNFVIYMSDNFEPFIKPITKNSDAKIINLSHELGIKPTSNMHIWMSIENIKKTVRIISTALNIPSGIALRKITDLSKYKKIQLSDLKSVLLLSDSLEYLFEDLPHVKVTNLYIKPGMTSARDIVSLSNQSPEICILINGEENVESIESKIGHKVVSVTSENWSLEGYKKIIDDIKSNCTTK